MTIRPTSARRQGSIDLSAVDTSRGLRYAFEQIDRQAENIDPSKRRRQNAGLSSGGELPEKRVETAQIKNDDWRVRLSLPTGNPYFYNDDTNKILRPLTATNGLIWPYTPQIILSHSAQYASTQPTHSNYAQYFYGSSMIDQIQVSGEFTAQNSIEASYIIAAITFLRSATKMFYGRDEIAGTPPPVLRLNGYGDYIFKDVPVVITSFTSDFNGDIDYINAYSRQSQTFSNNETVVFNNPRITVDRPTRVPTKTTITVVLQPVYSRTQMQNFGLKDFSEAKLIDKGFI